MVVGKTDKWKERHEKRLYQRITFNYEQHQTQDLLMHPPQQSYQIQFGVISNKLDTIQ